MATRVALLLLALFALASVRTGTAGAHANLERSEPEENAVLAQSPFEIKLYFTEPPELESSHINVLDTSGNRLDNDDLHEHNDPKVLSVTVPALPDGTYTVAWKAISAVDGHATAGTFAFTVGAAPPPGGVDTGQFGFDVGGPPRWLSAMVRWLGYASFFALLGIAAFPILILRPSLRDTDIDATENRVWRLVVIATLMSTGLRNSPCPAHAGMDIGWRRGIYGGLRTAGPRDIDAFRRDLVGAGGTDCSLP